MLNTNVETNALTINA